MNKATTIGTCDFCKASLEIVRWDNNNHIIRCERCRKTYGNKSKIEINNEQYKKFTNNVLKRRIDLI